MIKKLTSFGSALALSMAALYVLGVPHAFAATRTWDGGGTDSNFTTKENWSTDVAPVAGDSMIFDASSTGGKTTITNDNGLGTAFASVTFQGTGPNNFLIAGNGLIVTGGITVASASSPSTFSVTLNGDQTINIVNGSGRLNVTGSIVGTGNLTKTGPGVLFISSGLSYTGSITASAGMLIADSVAGLGTAAGSTTINDGASLELHHCVGTGPSFTENITLNGSSNNTSGDFPTPKLFVSGTCAGSPIADEVYGFITDSTRDITLSGNITLGSDITFGSLSKVNLTGALSGNYMINIVPGYGSPLIVNSSSNANNKLVNGTYTAPVFKKTLSDDQPSNDVAITGSTEITITGRRGDVTISGGTLKGGVVNGSLGTIGVLTMSGGKVAPGLSPGVLNTGNLVFTGGTLEEEIGGTSTGQFDRLNVTGTVALGSATTLTTTLYNGFTPALNNSFTIIDNDGSDLVTGTFAGLADGATFTLSGYTFRINYNPAGGNDVVLTVTGVPAVPAVPNTGLHLLTNNPLATLAATLFAVTGTLLIGKHYRKLATKRS
jgi:autotransporter-associated beta strand protein